MANRGTPKPSLNDCIDIARQGFKVPACASYRIQEKANPQQQPIAFNKTPKPTAKQPIQLKRLNKPTTVAYTPKAPKAKPSYQVNYAAGEIQTVDQFQEEFYGSGQTSAPQLSRMTAKVIDHVEWLSPEDAQKVII
ncbi:MAG: hypothetical protein HC768_23775, partial [Acaryochloris sp. CRU_2_0]|nr:hypothetical protein [Acaryochloris sp. CRU_2_0]